MRSPEQSTNLNLQPLRRQRCSTPTARHAMRAPIEGPRGRRVSMPDDGGIPAALQPSPLTRHILPHGPATASAEAGLRGCSTPQRSSVSRPRQPSGLQLPGSPKQDKNDDFTLHSLPRDFTLQSLPRETTAYAEPGDQGVSEAVISGLCGAPGAPGSVSMAYESARQGTMGSNGHLGPAEFMAASAASLSPLSHAFDELRVQLARHDERTQQQLSEQSESLRVIEARLQQIENQLPDARSMVSLLRTVAAGVDTLLQGREKEERLTPSVKKVAKKAGMMGMSVAALAHSMEASITQQPRDLIHKSSSSCINESSNPALATGDKQTGKKLSPKLKGFFNRSHTGAQQVVKEEVSQGSFPSTGHTPSVTPATPLVGAISPPA